MIAKHNRFKPAPTAPRGFSDDRDPHALPGNSENRVNVFSCVAGKIPLFNK
jgi:hypothetical protein